MYTNIIDLDERKPNSNNILANLPDEDQRRIHEWLKNLSYEAAVEQIALPRPEGLDLKIHYTSLRNYYRRFIHPDRIVRRNMLLDTYRDMAEMAIDDPIPFMIVVAEGLQRHLADLAHEPKPSLKDLERLFRIFHKIQDMDLKRERLNLAKEKADKPPVGRVPKSAPSDSPTSVPTPGVPAENNSPSQNIKEYQEMEDFDPIDPAPAAQNIKKYQTIPTESLTEEQALANMEAHYQHLPLPYPPYAGHNRPGVLHLLPAAAGFKFCPPTANPLSPEEISLKIAEAKRAKYGG